MRLHVTEPEVQVIWAALRTTPIGVVEARLLGDVKAEEAAHRDVIVGTTAPSSDP